MQTSEPEIVNTNANLNSNKSAEGSDTYDSLNDSVASVSISKIGLDLSHSRSFALADRDFDENKDDDDYEDILSDLEADEKRSEAAINAGSSVKHLSLTSSRSTINDEKPPVLAFSKKRAVSETGINQLENENELTLSENALSLARAAAKSMEKEKDNDLRILRTTSSTVSIDRVEVQRQQILKNRLLQDKLRDLQSAQRREIDGLKKALGVQANVIEEKVEANLSFNANDDGNSSSFSVENNRIWNMSQCSSMGDISQIYGNRGTKLNSIESEAETTETESPSNAANNGKTPLRIRLKRRILRHQKNNHSSSISPNSKQTNTTKKGTVSDIKKASAETTTVSPPSISLSSYSKSLNTALNGTSNHQIETQSDILVTNNRLRRNHFHKSDPLLPIVPSFSYESTCDIDDIIPSNESKSSKNQQEGETIDWEDTDDEANDDNSIGSASQNSLRRLSRQVRMGRMGEMPCTDTRTNKVMIHVYDLIQSETMVTLPWGCNFPLGQCFNAVNNGLHMMGTGAYHVGVEVNGVEYAFGANNVVGLSGVFTCLPRKSAGYDYRCTLDFGARRTIRRSWISVPDPNFINLAAKTKRRVQKLNAVKSMDVNEETPKDDLSNHVPPHMTQSEQNWTTTNTMNKDAIPTVYREVETFVQGHELMQQMAREYLGCEYDLLRKNCCTFARDTCLRLGVKKEEIPSWFLSLAEAGVATENCVAGIELNVVSPLKRILSGTEEAVKDNDEFETEELKNGGGFEVIAKKKRGSQHHTELEIVRIVESMEQKPTVHINRNNIHRSQYEENPPFGNAVGIRHSLSWTY